MLNEDFAESATASSDSQSDMESENAFADLWTARKNSESSRKEALNSPFERRKDGLSENLGINDLNAQFLSFLREAGEVNLVLEEVSSDFFAVHEKKVVPVSASFRIGELREKDARVLDGGRSLISARESRIAVSEVVIVSNEDDFVEREFFVDGLSDELKVVASHSGDAR